MSSHSMIFIEEGRSRTIGAPPPAGLVGSRAAPGTCLALHVLDVVRLLELSWANSRTNSVHALYSTASRLPQTIASQVVTSSAISD